MLNEATLENRIGTVLKKTFPTFHEMKVKHQESFSIKFGHHNVKVDLKEPSNYPARAIFDILLTTEDEQTNLILLELKRESLSITEDDVEQGLSYARLIHPMPPLTMISNGKDNRFFNTYSKKQIKKDSIDLKFLKKIIDNSFLLATNDFKKTVEILLNKNPRLISQIINQISKQRFELLKGNLNDFTKPICESFIIKREIVKDLKKQCGKKNLIGLLGHSFSGKTNILYDFYKSYSDSNNAIYYIDCKDSNYSIFQQLSNHFTKDLGYLINKDKIREWIISSLNNSEKVSFTILLDNFNENVLQKLKDEVTELIDLIDGSQNTIIFSVDLISYNLLAKDKYRNYLTFFGNKTHIIKIKELSLQEFNEVHELLFNVSKAYFEHGAHFAIEYRFPRILRLLAANLSKNNQDLLDGQGLKIMAVPDYELFKLLAENDSFSLNLRNLFKKLAKAYILDRIENKNTHISLNLASHFGAISLLSLEKVFKDDISSLFDSGFVNKYEFANEITVVYPKIPELLAIYGIEYITTLIIKDFEENDIGDVYKKFEKICMFFLNGDIVGTGVLLNIGRNGHIDLFSSMVQHLQSLKPKKEKINDGTKARLFIEEDKQLNIEFKGDLEDEAFIGNFFPHLILSQLAGYPLRFEESDTSTEYNFHLQLILDIASNPISMCRISNFSFTNVPPITTYSFKDIGTVICGNNGIIEPIVQSIQKCFYLIPEQIERLYEYAFEKKIFSVIWRIYLAIRYETESTDDDLSKKANEFISKFRKLFPELFKDILRNELNSKNKDES